MRKWEIRYSFVPPGLLKDGQERERQAVWMGPFQNRELAERALANLASNSQFRGGEIVEMER